MTDATGTLGIRCSAALAESTRREAGGLGLTLADYLDALRQLRIDIIAGKEAKATLRKLGLEPHTV